MGYLHVGCAALIGLVFLAAAVSKLADLDGFAGSLPSLVPVRPGLAHGLAAVVAGLETLVPLLLTVPVTRPYGFGLAGLLLAAFTAVLARALRQGRRASCRCFGASAGSIGPGHVARNGVLLTVTGLGLLPAGGVPAPAGSAVAIAAGLTAALLIISFDDIVELFAGSS